MDTETDTGRPASRFGHHGVAWLLALAVFAAGFGYVVGVNDRAEAGLRAAGR